MNMARSFAGAWGWLAGALTIACAVGACNGKFGSKGADPVVPPPGPRPTYGPTVQAAKPPPPITGGTLLVTRENVAIASDPDRDRVLVVDLPTSNAVELALQPGDEPGRVVLDGKGMAYVVLRSGGAVATIDVGARTLVSRRAVCPAPRGIDYDAKLDRLWIACAGGELVQLPLATGDATTVTTLERDLHDVLVLQSGLAISKLRSADVLFVRADGTVVSSSRPADFSIQGANTQADGAFRIVRSGRTADGFFMVHQRARDPKAQPVSVGPGGYTSGDGTAGGGVTTTPSEGPGATKPHACGLGIVQASVSEFSSFGGAGSFSFPSLSRAVLPVDIATSTGRITVIAAGNGHTPELPKVYSFSQDKFQTDGTCIIEDDVIQPTGQAIAVSYTDGGDRVVQTREPATLVVYAGEKIERILPLGGASVEDTGHAVFHSNAGGFLACASCHLEGGEDGRVWSFDGIGPRRTQSIRGGILATAPFHWDGDLADMHALCGEVFSKRMSGAELDSDQEQALSRWVDAIPMIASSAPPDASAVDRGKAVFETPTVGCRACHVGGKLTNNKSSDVGTGGSFQVPSLRGLAWRAPYLHTGCAPTLSARFDPSCGGGDNHGTTSQLSPAQVSDLVAYLQTL